MRSHPGANVLTAAYRLPLPQLTDPAQLKRPAGSRSVHSKRCRLGPVVSGK